MKKRIKNTCIAYGLNVFLCFIWKTILAYSFILFSSQTLTAQTIDTNSNVGEIFVNGDALYYNEGEIAGKIIFVAKSSTSENKLKVQLHDKKKEKSKLLTSVEKEKKKVVKNPSKIHYTFFPSKSSDFFSSQSSTVYFAVNQVEHYIKKAKEKPIFNTINSYSFFFQIKHTSVNRDYVNNYKLSYYLQTSYIRPPPIS